MRRPQPTRRTLRPQQHSTLPSFTRRQANLGSLSGTILSPAQISNVAAAAGFSGDDLVTAVAIALAESNPPGNPNSHNTDGEDSRGLWQINVAAHPDLASYDLFDPQVNAQAAYNFYLNHYFYPWTTWTKGRYQQFLSAAQQGVIDDARGSYDASVAQPPSAVSSDLPTSTDLPTSSTNPAIIVLAIGGTALAVRWLIDELV